MPELPEVETMRRGLVPLVGSRIGDVQRFPCNLKPIRITPPVETLRRHIVGRTISDVTRVGKRVVVWFNGREVVVFEPRMTGLLLIATPPNQTHLRLQISLENGPVATLSYWDRRGLGSVRLLSKKQFSCEFGPPRLGPDALNLAPVQLQARLAYSRREIKSALLDQRAVAGIGNLYAAEILHLAGIHPTNPCSGLHPNDWKTLCAAMHQVLEQAILYEGSTLSDGTYRNALNGPGQYQNHHRVYGKEGCLCAACGQAKIARMIQLGRSTFFCPICQPKPRPHNPN